MNILVLGANGMLGSAMIKVISEVSDYKVYGTIRSNSLVEKISLLAPKAIILRGIDVLDSDSLLDALTISRPSVIVNCVGLIKQLAEVNDPLRVLPINSLLPHRLAKLAKLLDAKLIHISTDCVFSGDKGGYFEFDISDAKDLYGRSKFIGEVYGDNAVTLRTSIIGHELNGSNGLLEWFLSQNDKCNGYSKVIFSGLPTVSLSRIIRDYVITRPKMTGLYHVASEPISKFNLLKIISEVYKKDIDIVSDEALNINRSLNASKFKNFTGFISPAWRELVAEMHEFQFKE